MKGKIFGLFLLTAFTLSCSSSSTNEEKAPQQEARSIKMLEDSLQKDFTIQPLDDGKPEIEVSNEPPQATKNSPVKNVTTAENPNERVIIQTDNADISLPSQGNNPVGEIKTEYQKSILLWEELKSFDITVNECKVEMTIGIGEEAQTLNFNLKDLDIENKSVFEDDDFRPGMRIYTKNHEKKIKVKINGKKADPTDVLVMKLASRENVANAMFAFLDLMEDCQ